MIKGLIGKKVGMSQVFQADGELVPVTIVAMPQSTLIRKKTVAKDGYDALQVGFEELSEQKEKKLTKPYRGQFKQQAPQRYLKEFATSDISEFEIGHKFSVDIFKAGDLVDVSGTSKGRGFAGVIKRHGFSGGPASHGHRFHRSTGSIGQRKSPGHVFKQKRMPGHMGSERITTQNLVVVDSDKQKNLLLIRGAIPGLNGGLVEVKFAIKAKPKAEQPKQ